MKPKISRIFYRKLSRTEENITYESVIHTKSCINLLYNFRPKRF